MAPALLLLAAAVAAPNLKDKPAPEPTLVGEWVPESVTVGGRPSTPGSDRWAFRADGTYALYGQGARLDGGELTGDVGKAGGTLDLASENRGPTANLCRFRVDGDTLTLAVGHNPGGRPADVEPGPKVTVWVMKRVRPEK
jgi:hypothetical protein